MIVEALFGKQVSDRIECNACSRRCKLPEGGRGFCYVRQNVGGRLFLTNYGIISAMQIDPIEKKPFNHFMPGSYVLGLGTSSCNWGCQFCQNHNISKERDISGSFVSPKRVIKIAKENNVGGIAFTYNEPTIFIEYALDVAREAHRHGLYAVFVTNGYMTKQVVREMEGNIDAVVVNFKGNGEQKFSNRFELVQSNEPVKEALVELVRYGIHVEITDLVVPGVGDSLSACDSLTQWIVDRLGSNVPVHFTRFHPDYKMLDYIRTPLDTLEKHREMAIANGLKYVYLGNCPGNAAQNTYCPSCGNAVVKRDGAYLVGWGLDIKNRCTVCGESILISGKFEGTLERRSIISLY